MGKAEKSFQAYFLKVTKDLELNYYRTSLSNGTGYPDITAFHGVRHSVIELKDLILGKRGDKKLRQLFEDSQPPWYLDYLRKGGKRLFIAFRIREHDESGRRYGLLHVDREIVMMLMENCLYYHSLLKNGCPYKEFKTLKELIEEIEK